MNVNFAERAHNHNWKLDPIVRSLLDTDFYKLLMLQFIWKNFPQVQVTSEVVNRTVAVRLAERVSAAALVEQMEHVRGCGFAGRSWSGWRVIRSMGRGASSSRRFWSGWSMDFRLSDYVVTEQRRAARSAVQRAVDRGDDVGGVCAGDRERAEDAVGAGAN